jgi:hypothetical protein
MEGRGDGDAECDLGVLAFDLGVKDFRGGGRGEGVQAMGEEDVACAGGVLVWPTTLLEAVDGMRAPCTVR